LEPRRPAAVRASAAELREQARIERYREPGDADARDAGDHEVAGAHARKEDLGGSDAKDDAACAEVRLDELAARNKEIADKLAKQKAEKEAMKAAMARDRAEVAARGPAQASIAKKLPTESGGTMTSAIFSEQEEAEGRRNAQ
jgi:hypothetical protein